MFENKVKLLIILSHFFLDSQGLEKLESKEDSIILVTETALRNTTNKLFFGLNFNKQVNPKIKQALLVHNFFTSVTLKDHNTLNLIVKLSRVDKHTLNNETQHCIDVINELLNEDWNGAGVESLANNEGIIEYVDEFINNINGFKGNSGYNNDYEKLDIKDEIIHILKSDNPSEFNPSLKQNQTATLTPEKEDEFNSDDEFWAPQPTRRIYKGARTKIKYFPFMASIQIFKNFQCAGSIIKSDLIVTAASCLQLAWNNRFFRENPAFLSARVGSNFYNGGGEEIPVLEVYFHPDYNPKNLKNNIAVLRLLRHLKFSKHKRRMKKIEIDREDSPLSLTTDGITIVGWGARGSNNIVRDPWSNQLAVAVLDVYHLQECHEIYSREYVTRTNFCAGFVSKGGGACNHDVGGPGVVNGRLAGIISFGSPVCGTPDAPTVFTKVGYYADWIEEIMDQDVPSIRKKTTITFAPLPNTPPAVHLIPTTFKILPLSKWNPKPIHEIEEKTFLKIGERDPEPIHEIEAEILLKDEDLFQDFLNTMFTSKEASQYNELLNDFPVQKSIDFEINPIRQHRPTEPKTNTENTGQLPKGHLGSMTGEILETFKDNDLSNQNKNNPMMSEAIHEQFLNGDGFHDLFDNEKDRVVSNTDDDDDDDDGNEKKYTVIDADLTDGEDEEAIDKNIVKLIDNINTNNETSVSSETSEESSQDDMKYGSVAAEEYKYIDREGGHVTKMDANNVAEKKVERNDVLTLLYVSNNEKDATLEGIESDIEDFDDNISDGLPIEVKGFQDFTFRNNITKTKNKTNISLFDFFSRSEFYDLLSEAIDEVTNY